MKQSTNEAAICSAYEAYAEGDLARMLRFLSLSVACGALGLVSTSCRLDGGYLGVWIGAGAASAGSADWPADLRGNRRIT